MADTAPPIDRERVAARGLQAPAEIIVDQWGIPHIYAASAHDAFFAQGWNAARDRLWQIDLWRKRGLGLLSENFGPDLRGAGSGDAAVPLPRRHGRRMGGLRAGREGVVAGVRRRDQRLCRAGAGRAPRRCRWSSS